MNFNSLIPDFNALGRIDYRKPVVDTKNTVALVALVAAVLGVIFVFLPWFSATDDGETLSRLGISQWYGIFGFIFAVVTVACILYKQYALAFWVAVLCVLMGIIGWCSYADITVAHTTGRTTFSRTFSASEIKEAVKEGDLTVNHIGAILFFLSGLVTAACSFMLATGKSVEFKVK